MYAFNSTQEWTAQLKNETGLAIRMATEWVELNLLIRFHVVYGGDEAHTVQGG
jgi:hypothetical protein